MSDFVFSWRPVCSVQLVETIHRLTRVDRSEVTCFEGPWGSLAVSRNQHTGFQPYETQEGIAVIVGGPLPKVAGVSGPGIDDTNRGTATVARRFFQERTADWHLDLLAPCCFFYVDKQRHIVTIITDEMSFIPAYVGFRYGNGREHYLSMSTHPDAAALHASDGGDVAIDPISACDLVMNRIITYPHTLHKNVRELAPGSLHRIEQTAVESKSYWYPVEGIGRYRGVPDAAQEAREAILEVVERAAEYYGRLGLLLSAGEDSRTVACMVPRDTPLHCFTVAPSDNRELQIARRVARALGATWESVPLPAVSYMRDVSYRSLFTGSSCVSGYAHFVGLLGKTVIAEQPVVLGGFKADTFLKGHYLRTKHIVRGIPFQRLDSRPRKTAPWERYFSQELLAEVQARKRRHHDWVQSYLPTSAERWVAYWPMSQDHEIAYYWSDRRMFASLEVFMTARMLDLAASVPTEWTLNRRLFQAMAARHLRRLWWVPHGNGHFPAFPWYVNLPIRPVVRSYWKLRLGRAHRDQGSWPSLEDGLQSPQGSTLAQQVLRWVDQLGSGFSETPALLCDTALSPQQRYAYLQVLAMLEQFAQFRQPFATT